MQLEVEDIQELDDGGAVMTLKFDSEAAQALISEGLLSILKRELRQTAELHPAPLEF